MLSEALGLTSLRKLFILTREIIRVLNNQNLEFQAVVNPLMIKLKLPVRGVCTMNC